MPQSHTIPLVGAHFRPPAKAIIQSLPSGCPLILRREPDNPYDPHAIQVWVATPNIPADGHTSSFLAGFGWTLDQLLAEPEWHLGFLASKPPKGQTYSALAPDIAPQLDAGAQATEIALSFDASGNPLVKFTLTTPA